MGDNLKDQLERDKERAEEGFPDRWEHDEEGDMLIGEIMTIDTGIPTEFGEVDVATILDEETGEEVSLWLTHTVLENEWRRSNPSVGDRVGVAYLGTVEKEKTRNYENYTVRVDGEDQSQGNQNQAPAGSSQQSDSNQEDDAQDITQDTKDTLMVLASNLVQAQPDSLDRGKNAWWSQAAEAVGHMGPLDELDEETAQDMVEWMNQKHEDLKFQQADNDETEDDIPF